MMPPPPPATSDWTAPIARVLAHRPIGVLCDVDGTLSPIAPTPDAAFVPDAIRRALRDLLSRVGLVAAVSGRPAAQVAVLLDLPDLVIVGNHGFEQWTGGKVERPPELAPYLPRLAAVAARAHADLALPGLLIEDKTATLSLHYRRAADPEAARRALLDWARAAAAASGLIVTEGRRVVEIRPPLDHDKGTAVLALIDRYHLRGVLYLGDDRTDLDAFEALRSWRAGPDRAAVTVAVAGAEAPPEVCDAADLCVEGIDDVERLLRWLSEQVQQSGGK